MCQVQRVTNTCGHLNDHVTMACNIAKKALGDSEPGSPSAAAAVPASRTRSTSSPPPQQQQATISVSVTIDQSYHEHHGATQSQNQDQNQGLLVQQQRERQVGEPADRIRRTGFDARTQPYCLDAVIRDLSSPQGFKCMVVGCGRAD